MVTEQRGTLEAGRRGHVVIRVSSVFVLLQFFSTAITSRRVHMYIRPVYY